MAVLARKPAIVGSSPGNGDVRPWFDSTRYAPLATANSIVAPIPARSPPLAACSVPEMGMTGWKKRPPYRSAGGK